MRDLAVEDEYQQLGEEFLTRAVAITSPELRALYLRLAVAYAELARFHERVKPHGAVADLVGEQITSAADPPT